MARVNRFATRKPANRFRVPSSMGPTMARNDNVPDGSQIGAVLKIDGKQVWATLKVKDRVERHAATGLRGGR